MNNVLQFLTKLYEKGLSYSAIGIARSAINSLSKTVSNVDINNDSLITRFMKGVFNSRPALPKYQSIWDVNTVLRYLAQMNTTPLLMLSAKLSMLFLLLTAQRCQTLHLICVDDVTLSNDMIVISTPHLLKTSRPGHHQKPFTFEYYKPNNNLCIGKCLQVYLDRTRGLRSTNKLMISTLKPHGPASKQTIARWIKLILQRAGVDDCFKPHSTRAASSSMASMCGIPLTLIVKSAGWKNVNTFAKYYQKPLTDESVSLQCMLNAVVE